MTKAILLDRAKRKTAKGLPLTEEETQALLEHEYRRDYIREYMGICRNPQKINTMNKFIELHYAEDGKPFIFNTDLIRLIHWRRDQNVRVMVYFDEEQGMTWDTEVLESYEEIKELLGITPRKLVAPKSETPEPGKRYVYGLRGIQGLFNVSHATAQKYKDGIIADACYQSGRTIIVDADKAIELFKGKKKK